jgi:hypothetical protein
MPKSIQLNLPSRFAQNCADVNKLVERAYEAGRKAEEELWISMLEDLRREMNDDDPLKTLPLALSARVAIKKLRAQKP